MSETLSVSEFILIAFVADFLFIIIIVAVVVAFVPLDISVKRQIAIKHFIAVECCCYLFSYCAFNCLFLFYFLYDLIKFLFTFNLCTLIIVLHAMQLTLFRVD